MLPLLIAFVYGLADGATITGGITRSSWAAQFNGDGVVALGGGIEIPLNANFDGGATVTVEVDRERWRALALSTGTIAYLKPTRLRAFPSAA